MSNSVSAAVLLLVAGLSTAAQAQMDAIVVSLNRCDDPSQLADIRIRNCMAVINASGVDQDEIAFAWLDLAIVYQSQGGDRQRELDAYSRALALQPNLWQARANRASLYLEAGDGDHALADFLALRQSGPDKLQLWRGKSDTEYRTGHIEGSTTDRSNMDRPGREEADYANALNELGRALRTGLGDGCKRRALAGLELDAAVKDCEGALEIDPSDETAHLGRGIVAFRQANWQLALTELNAVQQKHPNSAEALLMKGIVERRMGNNSARDADIAAAKAIDSHVPQGYGEFGILP
jgi:tetratricopeptide (TPR) repeat protein